MIVIYHYECSKDTLCLYVNCYLRHVLQRIATKYHVQYKMTLHRELWSVLSITMDNVAGLIYHYVPSNYLAQNKCLLVECSLVDRMFNNGHGNA